MDDESADVVLPTEPPQQTTTVEAAPRCPTCHRVYEQVEDLPPVCIVGVEEKTDGTSSFWIPVSWNSNFFYDPKSAVLDRQGLLHKRWWLELVEGTEEERAHVLQQVAASVDIVPVRLIDIGVGRFVRTKNYTDGTVFYDVQHDALANMPKVFEDARSLMPFKVVRSAEEVVSPVSVWTGLKLKPYTDMFGTNFMRFCLREEKIADGALVYPVYWGLTNLCWTSDIVGTFDIALYQDGPNMGSAGGPTLVQMAILWRIRFALP